ncbi:MAG: hypothetical protein DRJ38_00240 [Thermoprotei archaeon]|nr:MAG: hypothetical protein DRJ38_00240 [Thermoprotei archaeon]
MPISLDEFNKLPAEKAVGSRVSNEELLAELSQHAMTTAEVAAFLGVKTGSAYRRLKQLLDKGLVVVRYDGAKAYWAAAQTAQESNF